MQPIFQEKRERVLAAEIKALHHRGEVEAAVDKAMEENRESAARMKSLRRLDQ